MAKQRPSSATIKPLKPARELAAMVAKLSKEEQLKVEGIIIGVGLVHKKKTPIPPTDSHA